MKDYPDTLYSNFMDPMTLRETRELGGSIRNILSSGKVINDPNLISLGSIADLIKRLGNAYDVIIEETMQKWNLALKNNGIDPDSINLTIYPYDFKNHELHLELFRSKYPASKYMFSFKRTGGDIYINQYSNGSVIDPYMLLSIFGSEISKLYGDLESFPSDVNDSATINLPRYFKGFPITIDSKHVEIDKLLSYSKYGYRYLCNSIHLIESLRGHEDDLLNYIYVPINDCPYWSRQQLNKIRSLELVNCKETKHKVKTLQRSLYFDYVKDSDK